jgi:hypothetical protein
MGSSASNKKYYSPTEVTALRQVRVTCLASGDFHMLAVCEPRPVRQHGE